MHRCAGGWVGVRVSSVIASRVGGVADGTSSIDSREGISLDVGVAQERSGDSLAVGSDDRRDLYLRPWPMVTGSGEIQCRCPRSQECAEMQRAMCKPQAARQRGNGAAGSRLQAGAQGDGVRNVTVARGAGSAGSGLLPLLGPS